MRATQSERECQKRVNQGQQRVSRALYLLAGLSVQVRVATSKDLREQVGSKVFFDLVDFEQARTPTGPAATALHFCLAVPKSCLCCKMAVAVARAKGPTGPSRNA